MSTTPYAVIETGGKQYLARAGDVLQVEKLPGNEGDKVTFDHVLLWSGGDTTLVGRPTLAGAKVTAEILNTGRGDKIIVGKYKRKKQYRREIGHRQWATQLLVTGLVNGKGTDTNLDAETRKTRLAKFQSHLTPFGGHPQKVRKGSVSELSAPAKAETAAKAPAKKAAAPVKAAPAKKATAAPKAGKKAK